VLETGADTRIAHDDHVADGLTLPPAIGHRSRT
jgi:hypothetical protein